MSVKHFPKCEELLNIGIWLPETMESKEWFSLETTLQNFMLVIRIDLVNGTTTLHKIVGEHYVRHWEKVYLESMKFKCENHGKG